MNPLSDYRRSTTPSPAVLVPPIPTTDGELLMRFARHGDDAAFTQLVEKHGRLVWTVCWQVLRQHHEIEDAFQATFFILAKRARSIRSCDSLCGWLYRVAYRTALRSRMSSKRKQLFELVNDELSTLDEKLKRIEQDEQRAALMEELHSLPEQYQMPLVLCYLEGKSRRTAAEELGTTVESVKGRLTRGRQLLRHRLIRRGVSLSIAMAAMTIPVKSASAAVTPALVGLTVAGAGKWIAGATAAGIASTISTSAKVVHLAHQGTVAMTIAAYAKPAVVVLALLTGVSATVAVDSPGKGSAATGGETVSLAAAADATAGDDIELVAAEGDAVTVAPIETAKAEGNSKKRFVTVEDGVFQVEQDANKKGGTVTIPDGNFRLGKEKGTLQINDERLTIEAPANRDYRKLERAEVVQIEVGKPRKPAPARSPQVIEFRGQPETFEWPTPQPPVNVTIPAMPPIAEFPIMREFNWQMNQEFNVELQLKVAELESKVSQLQLESKELEIAAFDADEKQKILMIEESKKKLLMAEAEQLKIQMERQRAQMEELRKALREQAKEIVKKAEQAGEEAIEKAAKAAGEEGKRVSLQARKAAQEEAHAALEEARAVIHQKAEMAAQAADITARFNATGKSRPFKMVPQYIDAGSASELMPGSRIHIQARGVDPESPLDHIYTVEPMGTVALGVSYGRVKVEGLSVIDAEKVILEHLKQDWENPRVQVTFEGAGNREPRYGD
jgi:RNA polymerase sigma factor (sigma-70 family)